MIGGTPGRAVHHDEYLAAGRVLLAERERLLRVVVWSRKLLDAEEAGDEPAAARARDHLRDALAAV